MTSNDRTKRIVKLGSPGLVTTMGRKQKAERITLDFATWRAHLAAPGSRFEPAQPAFTQIVRLDTVSHAAESSEAKRRTA